MVGHSEDLRFESSCESLPFCGRGDLVAARISHLPTFGASW